MNTNPGIAPGRVRVTNRLNNQLQRSQNIIISTVFLSILQRKQSIIQPFRFRKPRVAAGILPIALPKLPYNHVKRRYYIKAMTTRPRLRSAELTSELQSLMRISYAVFCLNKTNINRDNVYSHVHTGNTVYLIMS